MNIIQKKASEFYEKAGIIITDEEKERIEIADFGLDDEVDLRSLLGFDNSLIKLFAESETLPPDEVLFFFFFLLS